MVRTKESPRGLFLLSIVKLNFKLRHLPRMNEYPDILSSKKPIRTTKIKKDSSIDELYEDNVNDSDYIEYIESNCLLKSEIENIIADLNLSIEKSEYLNKKLKQHKLVEKMLLQLFTN
ncbi:hypothetical protein A3Q56_07699 [Intoshia linei]|uniref:Uncharacterized protein n=1 Tax=Intoshia linei TaxID=1819745 RepID=A0A177ATN7_9BILA|nr:hypothetical protein A3Q56_07699 [Intoshia linei]